MPRSSLKLEKLNIPTTVLLLGGTHRLLEEVNSQLKFYPNIRIATSDVRETELKQLNLSVVVHFVGFGKPSLFQTLSATELLHQSLNLSLQNNSKFILVVSNSSLPLCRTAITLVTQFVKVNKILHEVIEVDPLLSVSDTAEYIICRFIYHHQKNKSGITPGIKFSHSEYPRARDKSLHLAPLVSWIKKAFVLMCIFYLILCFQLLLLIPLTNCAVNSFLNNRFSESLMCSRLTGFIYKFIHYQGKLFPGVETVLTNIGGPNEKVTGVILSFSNMLTLLTEFDVNSFLTGDSRWFAAYDQSSSTLKSDLKFLYQSSVKPLPLLVSVADKSENLKNVFDKLETLVSHKDIYMGYIHPTTYLLVLQDSSSIWPTGGVIDTLLKITLDRGVVQDLQIYDAKILASQITGSIDPPADLGRLTGMSNWSFLQANWDPDFSRTAKKIIWFFNKVFSAKIDFVVGLNDSVFPELLSVTGPVQIAGLSETVTVNNYRTFKLSQINRNPGNDDVSFLGKTLIAIKDKIRNSPTEKKKELTLAILDYLDKRQILVASITNSLPELNQIGWDGGIDLSDCLPRPICQNMYLYLVDTDMSSNGTDYLLNEETNIRYLISDNWVGVKVSVILKQPGESGKLTHGSNLIYKRIFLPVSARLVSARVNNKSVLSDMFPVGLYNDLVGWGFLINTAADSESSLEVEYNQPLLVTDSKLRFYIDIPNQPGVGDYVGNITIGYPKQWQATTTSNPAVATPGTLRYNTSSRNYLKTEIDFIKK